MYSEMSLAHSGTFWRSHFSPAMTIPADGCVDIILLDDALWLAGPSTRRVDARADGAMPTSGLRFAPGTVAENLQIDLVELRDARVLLRDLLELRQVAPLENAIRWLTRENDAGRQLTAPAAVTTSNEGWVPLVLRAARRHVSLARTAQQLGWSERHLHRRMIAAFGYSYPTRVRIERALRASSLIAHGTPLGDAVGATGYSDQAHMTREFARFIGSTPGQVALSSA